jgi:hypothetical protein
VPTVLGNPPDWFLVPTSHTYIGTAHPADAAERENVRKAINLVTLVKMPYPETLTRNRAKNGTRLARSRRCNNRMHHARGASVVL